MSHPFENPRIRNWFFGECTWPEGFAEDVITMGSGPFDENDFDNFLKQWGIEVWPAGTDFNVLVIGRYNWDEKELDKQLEVRCGRELRVYSQEMLLSYLATGNDPYNYNNDFLRTFGEGHSALEWLKESGFDWPKTSIVPGVDVLPGGPDGWPQVGLLKHLGYQVGTNGTDRVKRRRILRNAFIGRLPNVVDDSYMQGWGEPNTKKRLRKLAYSIASFTCLSKRKRNPSQKAIDDWEEDLAWLKKEFYHGRFTFSWPDTTVYY